MIGLFYLMIGSFAIGRIAEREKNKIENTEYGNRFIYVSCMIVISLWFILFSGLRTAYNDTKTYVYFFEYSVSGNIDFSIKDFFTKPYYGFDYWQNLIKYFFDKGQWLLMINAIVTVLSYIMFYTKYSKTLSLTLLCYIIIGTYLLSMAAQKQLLAMAISLYAIDIFLKKKYVLYYILIIIAYTFHPYIVVLMILPLLLGDVWSKKMITIVLIVAAGAVAFSQIIGIILGAADAIGVGKEYSVEEMTSNTINPIRVLVDGLPIFLSWLWRNEVNKRGNKIIKLGINMMTISWLLTFTSLFANPIYVYRTGQYFASLNPIVVPWMLVYCMPKTRYKKILIVAYMLFYVIFTTQQVIQFGGYNILYDPFKHTNITTLFM